MRQEKRIIPIEEWSEIYPEISERLPDAVVKEFLNFTKDLGYSLSGFIEVWLHRWENEND